MSRHAEMGLWRAGRACTGRHLGEGRMRMVEPSDRGDGVRKTEDQLRTDVEKLSEQLRALGVAPFSGLPFFNRSQTRAHREFRDVSFLSADFGGSLDFRVERFRRALLAGKTPASLRCDGRYSGGS